MDTYDSRRRQRVNRARERQLARTRRQSGMAVPRENAAQTPTHTNPTRRQLAMNYARYGWLIIRDLFWHLIHKPQYGKFLIAGVAVVVLLFVLVNLVGGRIFPNVWALNLPLGGLTVEDAELKLLQAWRDDIRVQIMVDGQPLTEAAPAQLGLSVDARQAAVEARNVGMAGMPLGYTINPTVELEYMNAQDHLLELVDEVNYPALNAGFELVDGEVAAVPGKDGRRLDIATTLEMLQTNPTEVVRSRRLDLVTQEVAPDIMEAESYLPQVRQLVSEEFMFTGYDPFTDVTLNWSTPRENFLTWIEAGTNGLVVREMPFSEFVDELNAQIAQEEAQRYIDPLEAKERVEEAIAARENRAYLRMRYNPVQYTVESGDTGMGIARKFGLPWVRVDEANKGFEWEALVPGNTVNIPTPDLVVPLPPVPNKRIIVDLNDQRLVAFEDGQIAFSWDISSGMSTAPTQPGVYQVLSHVELAYGSSFDLCESGSCGQWEMSWFMGMYEIGSNVMNGFHGSVLLPNGTLLNGGSVGTPATYGCVMSTNENAKKLYDWADKGTIVEVVSAEYQPRSALGWKVFNREV